jgi:hypothetical protein
MSAIELACRWSLVRAYFLWKLKHLIRPFNCYDLIRGLGLEGYPWFEGYEE